MEKTQKTTLKNKKGLLYALIMGLFIMITFSIPFLQIFFPVRSQQVIEAKDSYVKVDDIKLEAEKEFKVILNDYHTGKINDSQLKTGISNYVPLIQSLEKKSEKLSNHLKKVKENDEIFGFRTSKIFVSNLGLPLVLTILGLFFLFLFFKEEDFFFRKIILAFAFIGIISGIYYLVWVFYPKGDLPLSTYTLMQFTFSIIGALVAFMTVKYIYSMSHINLKLKIQSLLVFIVKDIKEKYIAPKDKPEYVNDYIDEIEKLK